MTTLGYVVIEYNQASHWPSIESGDDMYDTIEEAQEEMSRAAVATRACGRGETYAIARVELVEGTWGA